MSHILDISTAIPEFTIEKEDIERFYSEVLQPADKERFLKKLRFLNHRTTIQKRHSTIPDYNGTVFELYKNGNYTASSEERMALYKKKIVPLASDAIDKVFKQTGINEKHITHLITVSCTGICAPGLEFLLAEKYNFDHVEKSAVNFLGCYAALKALKQAHYISQTDRKACVLIVCAELCSLHFYPSCEDEEIVANLLFSDGASAVIMCGEDNSLVKNKTVLKIDEIGSACIPGTAELMTWNISSSAFRMFLSKEIVPSIKNNIASGMGKFIQDRENINHWAIHPGGVKIVEAVQQGLELSSDDIAESLDVLKNFGNMSSPTILFIIKNIFEKIKQSANQQQNILACAFGPGINIEVIKMSSVNTSPSSQSPLTEPQNAIQI